MKPSQKRQDVKFSSSPVLGVHLPMWRSKLVVFMLFMAFVALAARAFWIQGPGNAFYQKQGEIRYQRRLELPATRGTEREGFALPFQNVDELLGARMAVRRMNRLAGLHANDAHREA